MKNVTLPSIMQKNLISSDTNQLVRNFAGNFTNFFNPWAGGLNWVIRHFVSLALFLLLMQGMATAQITYVANASATGNSITLPAGWAAGDMALVFAVRDGSFTAPTVPGTFTSINTPTSGYSSGGFQAQSASLAYRILQTGDVSFTFSNASKIEVLVLHGTATINPIAKNVTNGASSASNTLNYAALTGTTLTSSWIVGFGGHRSATNVNAATAGSMTIRSASTVTSLGMHSLTGVTSFSSTNWSTVNTSYNWVTSVVEVLEYVQPLYFRSAAATGNWNATTTWEQSADNSTWVPASRTPTSTDNAITILNGHNVTVTASVTADELTVNSGGTLTINSGQTLTVANGTGTDLNVAGTVVNSGTITISGGAASSFTATGTYQHAQNGGAIPVATWDPGSTCLVTGITNTAITSGLDQNFSNLTWNCAGQTVAVGMSNNSGTQTLSGNLTIQNTNSGSLILCNNNGGTGSRTLVVNGDFKIQSGTFNLSGISNTRPINLNIGGNLTIEGGTLTKQNTPITTVFFTNSGLQLYTKTGGTISSSVNFTVNPGSILDVNTSVIDGSTGTFTLSGDAGIITSNPDGLMAAGTNLGSIQTTSRTYSSGADYTYNGSSAQITGNGLTSGRNLTINNTSTGVSLSIGATFSGLLTMTSGTMNLAGHDLSVGALTGSGGITNNTPGTSTLFVGSNNNNSTYDGPILNGASGSMITTLTKNGSGTLTLTNSGFTFTGTTITSGGELRLNPGNTTSTLESPVVLSGGKLSTTNIGSGTTITSSSTLELFTNSSIDLGAANHSLIFAPSNGISWAGTTLTINGWTGTAGATGDGGKIFFGSETGLTNAQLLKISFTGYPGTAMLLPSGELVPSLVVSPVLSINGSTDHGISCANTAAAPITYTITNLGTTAHDVLVGSSDSQFAVSNLSSTTIAGGGGTATFQVTFTPLSGGAKSATITVSASDAGSNSPTVSLTGTGVAQPTASAGGSQRICQNGTATVSGATATNGTISWAEDGVGTITSGGTTETPTYTAAAGDAGNTVTLTMTVSNAPCIAATATYTVYVDALPTANAGPDQNVCAGGTITLAGSMGGGATTSIWTASSGTFGAASSLNSTYSPSIPSGTVVLTLTTSDPASLCSSAISTMTVTVNPLPVAAGATICQYGSGTLTASSASGDLGQADLIVPVMGRQGEVVVHLGQTGVLLIQMMAMLPMLTSEVMVLLKILMLQILVLIQYLQMPLLLELLFQ